MTRQSNHRESTPGHSSPPPSRSAAFRRVSFVLLVMALFLAAATTASASWTSTGSGTGSATVATLTSPTNLAATATTGGSTVSLSWTPSTVSTGRPAQGYYVTRVSNGDNSHVPACGTSPTTLTSAASCTDPGVPDGSYRYLATSAYNSWTAVSAASNSVTVSAASRLTFTGQPTPTVAGAIINPAVAVTVQDISGNPIAVGGISVTVGIGTNPSGGTLSGTVTALTDASGVASFSSLSINKAGAGYTFTAVGAGLTAATSSGFTITAAAGASLVFDQQPITTVAGTSITPAVTVQILDQFGNLTTSAAAVTLAIGSNPSLGTLSGTTTRTATTGVASFGGLSIDKAGTGYTLTATSGTLTGAPSSTFAITGAVVNKFVITSAAMSGQASATATVGPIAVQQQDSFGNPVVAPTGGTTVNLTSNSVGTTIFAATSGGPSVTFVTIPAGSATATFFYGDTKAGTPIITVSGSLTSATQTETITPSAASSVAFNQQPTNTVAGASMSPELTVGILDQFGNRTTSTAVVTVAIGTNPALGTLSGTQTQSANAGVATFAGLSIDRAGSGYTLTASSGTLTGAPSGAFTITPAAANKFVITSAALSGPASDTATLGAVTVAQQDNSGNPVVAPTGGTTVNLTSNSVGTRIFAATSGGPSVTFVTIPAGSTAVTFFYGDTKAGTPIITVSGSLTSATQLETITAATANRLGFGQSPTTTAAGASITPAVTVQILDRFGNLTTNSTAAVTLAIGTNPAAGTLSGTKTQTATAGAATFSGMSINKAGTGYTLIATSGGLTSATSNGFTITPGTATRLAWTPSAICSGQNGSAFALNYTGCGGGGATFNSAVNLTDANGNLVVNSTGAAITVSLTTSGGTISPSGTVAVAIPVGASTSGQITFTSQSGSWTANTITARSAGFADAAATFNK